MRAFNKRGSRFNPVSSQEKKIKVSGFTIVRNAQVLDYPFCESVESVLPLCDEFIICCGDSTDNTREICEALEKKHLGQVRVVYSAWERANQKDGLQLKRQTDQALAYCSGDWCFYIQADEVVHEADIPKIKKAIQMANDNPVVDGITFDYLHFYVSYAYLIRGRNWYRREVRAFKNHRGIESYRDAQGFRREGKRLQAQACKARIFHYGYVRSEHSLRRKSIEMSRWWGETPDLDPKSFVPKRHIGIRRFSETHPRVMGKRVTSHPNNFNPKNYRRPLSSDEIKSALALIWEGLFHFRLWEFRNYELVK